MHKLTISLEEKKRIIQTYKCCAFSNRFDLISYFCRFFCALMYERYIIYKDNKDKDYSFIRRCVKKIHVINKIAIQNVSRNPVIPRG